MSTAAIYPDKSGSRGARGRLDLIMDTMTDRPDRITRYGEIADALLSQIRDGTYQPGDRLPTEQELRTTFGASRHTVREALRQLQGHGYITRRQGSGSIVTEQPWQQSFASSISTIDDLRQYAAMARVTVVAKERIVADAGLARQLSCDEDTAWMRVSLIRHVETIREPICFAESYLHPDFQDVADLIGQESSAIYAMIEARHAVRVAEVRQDIRAAAADANIATRLNIAEGAPVLLIRRRYVAEDGRVAEIAVNYYAADRFAFEMTLSRQGLVEGS